MHRLLALVLLLALTAAACGDDDAAEGATAPTASTSALPFTFVGPDGVETVVEDASRIVSLSGEFSEIIWDLGLGPNLVGVDLSSVYPKEEMRLIPKIGVERLLLAEPILAQDPTVVIGDEDATPREVIDQVRQTGVPVVIFPRFMGIEAPATKIRAVGDVLGVPERAEELAASVQAEIDAAVARAASIEDRPRVAVVYVANRGETLLLLGDNTVMEGIIEAAGGIDVAPAAGADGMMPLTPEALAAGQPDVIVTSERALDAFGGMEGFTALPGVAQTPAGENGRILVYEDLYLLGLGPRTGDLLIELLEALHPDAAS